MLYKNLSLEQSIKLAMRIAWVITPKFTIAFNGELGAGKTTVIRYIIKTLGVLGNIKSPTYTLVESYAINKLFVHHFDLYRFNDKYEWIDSGFDEYFTSDSICLVEWPSRANDFIPEIDWVVNIMICGETREIEILAKSAKGKECLKKLMEQDVNF